MNNTSTPGIEDDLYKQTYTIISSISISKKNKNTWNKVLSHTKETGKSKGDLFCECFNSCYTPTWDKQTSITLS